MKTLQSPFQKSFADMILNLCGVAAKSQQQNEKEYALGARKNVFEKKQEQGEEYEKLKGLPNYDSNRIGRKDCNHLCLPDYWSYVKAQ
ncbi:MAG TPA: hypothetical protein VE978_20000 [Chitinophagales bacterium]|nr:hypothetical protein [Chitinophagales bacterium]